MSGRRNQVITAAVRDGCCTLSTARRVLQHTPRVVKIIPAASRQEIHGWFLQLDPAYGSRGVEALTRKLRALYDPDTLAAEDAHLDEVESLTWQHLATGMIRLIADLSPAHAAILKRAITTLSAPQSAQHPDDGRATAPAAGDRGRPGPVGTGNATEQSQQDTPDHQSDHSGVSGSSARGTVRDDRLPGKRRLDALVDLVGAGAKVACRDGTGVGAAATVLLTLDLDALVTGIGGATTITGDVLDAGAARRLACDAGLIPLVLGGDSPQRLLRHHHRARRRLGPHQRRHARLDPQPLPSRLAAHLPPPSAHACPGGRVGPRQTEAPVASQDRLHCGDIAR